MNWIDLVIILIIILYLLDGWRRGFILSVLELVGFAISIFLALRFYHPFGQLLSNELHFSIIFAKIIAFFLIWLVIEIIYTLGARYLYNTLPEGIRKSVVNKYFSFIPALIKGLIFLGIILTLLVALPISRHIKSAISGSLLGRPIVEKTAKIESNFENIFGGVANESLTFMTVQNSHRRINLNFRPYQLVEDERAQQEMYTLINMERASRGFKPLEWDEKLHIVAFSHAKDMLQHGYFAHENLEGKDVGRRLEGVGIAYNVAGENLALAPNTYIAHIGLMKSATHRDNILSGDFHKIGIGTIDAGFYGEMFVQVFMD